MSSQSTPTLLQQSWDASGLWTTFLFFLLCRPRSEPTTTTLPWRFPFSRKKAGRKNIKAPAHLPSCVHCHIFTVCDSHSEIQVLFTNYSSRRRGAHELSPASSWKGRVPFSLTSHWPEPSWALPKWKGAAGAGKRLEYLVSIAESATIFLLSL